MTTATQESQVSLDSITHIRADLERLERLRPVRVLERVTAHVC